MAAIIKTEDLHFSYPAAEGVTPVVLDGVSLSIEEGSFVAVLGHNGCGKSTLAKHMNAILLPSGGTVSRSTPSSTAAGAAVSSAAG